MLTFWTAAMLGAAGVAIYRRKKYTAATLIILVAIVWILVKGF